MQQAPHDLASGEPLASGAFGLSREHWRVVLDAVRGCLDVGQTCELWIFGSRATGRQRRYSDVDLLLSAEPHLTQVQLRRMCDALEDSDLPYRVDLVNEPELAPAYRPGVMAERKKVAALSG